jgi:P22_AR N-terminal domain
VRPAICGDGHGQTQSQGDDVLKGKGEDMSSSNKQTGIEFCGAVFPAMTLADGQLGVSLSALCEAFGVSLEEQASELREKAGHGLQWAFTSKASLGPTLGEIECLPVASIPMWAIQIDPSGVPNQVQRGRLAEFQEKAASVVNEKMGDKARAIFGIDAHGGQAAGELLH